MQEITVIFICAIFVLFSTRKAAIKIGLVDKPDNRKKHHGDIPLVGGVSLYLCLWILYALDSDWLPNFTQYMVCASTLLLIGVLDDRFDLPVLPRILLQALVAGMMMSTGHTLVSLGNILFGDELFLGWGGFIVTLFAVWGAINAFNMVDGIDGLLGALLCVTLGALAVMFYLGEKSDLAHWSLCLLVACIPYILLNLGIPCGQKFKVFMGDAGSTLMGFTVIWLLIAATQGEEAVMRPVTALWFIAIPLMDMVAVMIRRIQRGDSPFKPDREHLHHVLLRAGLSLSQTLLVVIGMAVICAVTGIFAERAAITESIMLSLFLLVFLGYFWALSHVWRGQGWMRRPAGQPVAMHSDVGRTPLNK